MIDSESIGERPTRSAFGHLLKRLRISADLTQEGLAAHAGVSARLVSDLERGLIRRPRRDTVELLADGLQLTGGDRDAFAARARGRPSPHETIPPPVSLPLPPTPFVGREDEIATVATLLIEPSLRLLTLTGPGGVGKTRLAIEVAARAGGAFPDGVCFVDLTPLRDASLVLPAIAQSLGMRTSGNQALAERLAGSIGNKCLLLVLDNVEQVAASAPAIADVLAVCPRLTVLATSREPLRIRAERECFVAPLPLPDVDCLPPMEEIAENPAVGLFVERAKTTHRGFDLTAENARAVAEIVARVDGLPLAIELAAARVKILPPAALLARLEQRLPLLTGGARDLPIRQQAMRSTIDWSYDLLSPTEQQVFRQLAIFAGGFRFDAAEAVAGGTSNVGAAVFNALGVLVEKNLVQPLTVDEDEPRFGMLETIREYGFERLILANEETATGQRHAAWCLNLAERGEPELMGPDQAAWFSRLEIEHDNLRASLRWAIALHDGELAARLGGALRRFWNLRGHSDEGRRWLEHALALNDTLPPAVRAKALLAVGVIAYRQGDYERATTLTQALELYRSLDDTAGVAAALCNLGLVAQAQGEYERATALAEESLALYRAIGDQNRVGNQLENLGLLAYDQGDYEHAGTMLDEALALARALGNQHSAAFSLNNLALVAHAQGDYSRAATLQEEALDLWRMLGNKDGLARCFENLARIAAGRNQQQRVVRLFGAAEALRIQIGAPGRRIDRDFNARLILDARAQLGDETFGETWQSGRTMSLDEAIAYAQEDSHFVSADDSRITHIDD
ncbi:MAG: ATP-binding protein [Thermomicrobiales bacterium]